jgi:hypothetical protein
MTTTPNDNPMLVNIPESPYYSLDEYGECSFVIEDDYGDLYRGDTIEEAIAELADSYDNLDASSDICDLTIKCTTYLKHDAKVISDRVRELNKARKAKNAEKDHAARLAAWEKELQALNDSADEYSTSGFNKRWQELLARKPVMP